MTLDEQIAIIQAVKDGKKVRKFDNFGTMIPILCDATQRFDFERYRYEIQREPMEIWCNVYRTGWIQAFNNVNDAREVVHGTECRTVKFREVLDDDNL